MASRFYYFSIDELDAVEANATPAPLPFATGDLLGLTILEKLALPLFQMDRSKDSDAPSGRVTLRIRTSKGLIRIFADGVSDEPILEEKDYSKGIDLAEQLVKNLDGDNEADALSDVTVAKHIDTYEFLIVRSADSYFAFPAELISHIEHPDFIKPMPRGQADEIIISASGSTIAGKSLALWLNSDLTADSERWALRLAGRENPLCLCVESIVGIRKIPRTNIQRLHLGGREGVWLNDGQLGLVECLDLANIFGDLPQFAQVKKQWDDLEVEPENGALAELETGRPKAWVGLNIGPYNLILPNELIVDVLGNISPNDLKQKGHPGHLATYDLGRIFVPERIEDPDARRSPISLHKQDGQCVVLADEVVALREDLTWYPAPALPPALKSVAQSVRIRDGKTEFLVKANVFETIPPQFLSEMAKTGLRGWIRKFRSEPTIGKSS